MQSPVVIDTRDSGNEHVVVLSGHQVAAHNVFAVPHGDLERAEHGSGLLFEGDADIHRHSFAEPSVIDHRPVPANRAARLQRLYPARCGGC